MRIFKVIVTWLIVAAVGFQLGTWLGRVLLLEVNSYLLQGLGVVAAIINATSFQVLRKFDDPPIKHLTRERMEQLTRVFEKRRSGFRFKWGLAIISGIGASVGGSLLRATALAPNHAQITIASYVLLAFTFAFGLLIAVEYSALSKLSRELPMKLEEEKRKRQL